MIPVNESVSANTLSAPYYPTGINGGQLLSEISNQGVILAGGLLSELKTGYFRVGHMGSINQGDVLSTIGAIELALKQCGYEFEIGSGLNAALKFLNSY
jgi:alanine-glyoxylate transaminase/serine-glyoxylate transaminase/serine-pyruvate transaminase